MIRNRFSSIESQAYGKRKMPSQFLCMQLSSSLWQPINPEAETKNPQNLQAPCLAIKRGKFFLKKNYKGSSPFLCIKRQTKATQKISQKEKNWTLKKFREERKRSQTSTLYCLVLERY